MKITKRDKTEAARAVARFDGKKSLEDIFYNLCFAILAPQTTFKSNIKAVATLREIDFYKNDVDLPRLHDVVRSTRFFRQKSDRLLRAKKQYLKILDVIFAEEESIEKRRRLVKMVKGIGMKAGSHLLRNLGHKDLAIIDTHVIKYLKCEQPKNTRDYLRIEETFVKTAKQYNMTPAELDAVVWKKYSNTPWEDFIY